MTGADEADRYAAQLREFFGENLRLARKRLGITQRDVSREHGVPQMIISSAEKGARNMTIATLAKLALAVGCDVPTMLRRPRY